MGLVIKSSTRWTVMALACGRWLKSQESRLTMQIDDDCSADKAPRGLCNAGSGSADAKVFFAKPADYLSENSTKIAVRAALTKSMIGSASGLDIVDLGCGDGTLSLQFLGHASSICLVDSSHAMLELAGRSIPHRLRSKVVFEHTDLDSFRPRRTFDVVLCIGVLAHVPSIARTLDLVARLLKPGGRCVVQITDSGKMAQSLAEGIYRFRRSVAASRGPRYRAMNSMTIRQTITELTGRGLSVDTVRYYEPVLLPGMGYLSYGVRRGLQYATFRRPRLARLVAIEALLLAEAPRLESLPALPARGQSRA